MLIDRLSESRVRQIIEPMLAGAVLRGDRLVDAFSYVEDLGLVRRADDGPPVIANPACHEIIPRALADPVEPPSQRSGWHLRGSLKVRGAFKAAPSRSTFKEGHLQGGATMFRPSAVH